MTEGNNPRRSEPRGSRRYSRPRSPRPSTHVTPDGLLETARHYIRDLVYGANDGIITTFAVVAGVAGGHLSVNAVLVIGAANLVADGLSMGVGNFLGIRSNESAREALELPEEEAHPARHAAATFLAFALAGTLPLFPYLLPDIDVDRFWLSVGMTLAALFGVGASRAFVTVDRWYVAGAEMLALGVLVAAVAYAAGALVGRVVT
jgi:VIT1/CCC1 family predicted Fe2+/Mn2+ transporter